MSWVNRQHQYGVNSLDVFDSPAPVATTYSQSATLECNDEMMSQIISLKGVAGAPVQSAGTAAAPYGETASLAFPSANTAGNTLVAILFFAFEGSLFAPITISDSAGNTYAFQSNVKFTGGLCEYALYVCTGCKAGSNTVTFTAGLFEGVQTYIQDGCIALLEYSGGSGTEGFETGIATSGTITLDSTTTTSGTLVFFNGICTACPGSPIVAGPSGGPIIPGAWLVVNEPSAGYTDRSSFLFLGDGAQHTFNLQTRQRGNASYTLVSDPQDPSSAPADYRPTLFQPIYLFDQNDPTNPNGAVCPVGYTLMFAGLIQDYTVRWVGTQGLHYIDCTAVSLEAVFDTVYCDGTDQFVNQTTGAIFTALFAKYETGCPVSLGTIQDGQTVPLFNPQKGQKISDVYDQLALTSEFIWGVNPQTLQLYFCLPTATIAPFDLTSAEALWDSISEKIDGADYRNRQGVKGSDEAFPQSGEWFAGSGQQQITLLRPVKQLVSAYITLGTPNHALGNFAGQPSPGDSLTIGPQNIPFGLGTYLIGQIIVENGFVQQITTPGTFTSTPTFSTITGGTSVGGGTGIFTCLGPYGVGAGIEAATTYTFVSTLDNTQYGQVLIGSSLADTVQNLVDAINSTAPYGGPPATNGRGVTFSLPTWEGAQVNAYYISGTQLKVINKQDAIVAASALSATSANFSWNLAQTAGGNFPQGSLGPNQPGTISIQVYQVGTNTAAPAIAYTPGSAVIDFATPLDAGSNANVWYTRADGGSVEVEDTTLVTELAATSHGTGKIQQFTDQSSQGLISASAQSLLQLAQQALAGFDTPPTELDVILYQPGILPGHIWTWDLDFNSALNGEWFVTEVKAELVPVFPWLDNPNAPGAGHYRYTIRVVDVSQIASYMDFWEGLGGGQSGGGAGVGALVPTSGASLSTSGNYGPQVEVDGTEWSGGGDGGSGILNLEGSSGITVTDLGGGDVQFALTGALPTSAAKYTASWSAQTSVTVTHNLGTTAVLIQVYDASGNLVIPQNVQITGANTAVMTFGASFTGSVVVIGLGAIPLAQSYATSWTAQTSVTVTHNLGTESVFVQVTDAAGNIVVPEDIDVTSSTALTLTFGAAFTGSVLVVTLQVGIKQYNASWSSQTSVSISHDLGTTAVIVQVYDGGGNQVIPQNVAVADANTVTLTFGASFTGSAVVMG
jgi:hypothetical protein